MDTSTDCELPPATRLAELRAAAEVELLGAVLARPADLVAVAEREGIAQWDFGQDDLRLIWLAAKIAGEAGGDRMAVLRLARRALAAEGLWDDTQIAGNWRASMLWSAESLGALACSHFPNPSQVEVDARRLLRIIRAGRRIDEMNLRIERIMAFSLIGRSPLSFHRRAG